MEEKLRRRGKGPAEIAKRAGRDLPRRLHGEAKALSQAEAMLAHPKLRAFVDEASVTRADRRLRDYLKTRDPERERTDRLLRWLAAAAFNLLLIFGLFVWWLAANGHIGPNTGG